MMKERLRQGVLVKEQDEWYVADTFERLPLRIERDRF